MCAQAAHHIPSERQVHAVVESVRTLEGAGFPVRRPFPAARLTDVDPFLLLDEMGPTRWGPDEAVGAPDHPHRGFETVSYLLAGRLEHRDSAGHAGVLGPGDVQWMTAGAGVVHSELPEADFKRRGGTWHGFQIWVNLPARDKMIPPRYQELPADRIPVGRSADGLAVARVVAGTALGESAVIETRTPIQLIHFTLQPGAVASVEVPEEQSGFVYVFAGDARVGDPGRRVADGQIAVLGPGNRVALSTRPNLGEVTELLVLSGVPLREPIARWGPFVMNTRDEIEAAISDYQSGRMGRIEP